MNKAGLLGYANERLAEIAKVRLFGTAPRKASILSFELEGVHSHDVGTILDREGVAVRSGHHCAQPLMDHCDILGTTRASLAPYNDDSDVDANLPLLAHHCQMRARRRIGLPASRSVYSRRFSAAVSQRVRNTV